MQLLVEQMSGLLPWAVRFFIFHQTGVQLIYIPVFLILSVLYGHFRFRVVCHDAAA